MSICPFTQSKCQGRAAVCPSRRKLGLFPVFGVIVTLDRHATNMLICAVCHPANGLPSGERCFWRLTV